MPLPGAFPPLRDKVLTFLPIFAKRACQICAKPHIYKQMISILIPTRDFDCSGLARDLQRQCAELAEADAAFRYEVIVLDDGSAPAFAPKLKAEVEALPGCRVVRAEQNVGRASGRNLLADEARFAWLLFIDSDAEVCTPDFIRRYWAARDLADVVCGALRNPAPPPQTGHELRYRYEKAAERRRPATYRNAHPYDCFATFNVMFRASVFQTLRFDERCVDYGYEDALMGLMLRKRGFSIRHIDNPLVHTGIDSNADFLGKTETALRTLARLGEPMQSQAGAARLYTTLRRLHLAPAARAAFRGLCPLLRRNLLGRHPSLLLFQLYKAGFYCRLQAPGA